MGGQGSGRKRRVVSMVDVLMTDNEFKDNIARLTVDKFNEIVHSMYLGATGQVMDTKLTPKGELVEIPIAFADRAKCAKVWKELTLDKVISDKRTIENMDNRPVLDHLSALNEVEAAIRKEQEQIRKAKEAEDKASNALRLVDGTG